MSRQRHMFDATDRAYCWQRPSDQKQNKSRTDIERDEIERRVRMYEAQVRMFGRIQFPPRTQ